MTAELAAENARLRGAIDRLSGAIDRAAEWLRGELDPRTLNEAIRCLNTELAPDMRIPEVAWGVASLGALQNAVKNLGRMVLLPEWVLPLKHVAPPVGAKRQPLGGIRSSA